MEMNSLKSPEDTNFTKLPCDILLLLQSYTDILNLRPCSTFFSQLNYFMRLNEQASLKYAKELNFRSRFDPRRISLNLRFCKVIKDVTMLSSVHTLNWSNSKIKDVSMLGGVHTLDLRACNGIKDVSMLGGVHTLNLYGCNGITDVSMLDKVHRLTLPPYSSY